MDIVEDAESPPCEISGERLTSFRISLERAFRENRSSSLSLVRIKEFINTDNSMPYSQGEIDAAINQMANDNQVMLTDGILFRI